MAGNGGRWQDRDNATSDDEFFSAVMNDAAWLFYGDLDEFFAAFVQKATAQEFAPPRTESPEYQVAYWLFVSELVRLDLFEYGTSPRYGWWTPDGERFKRIFDSKLQADPHFDLWGRD